MHVLARDAEATRGRPCTKLKGMVQVSPPHVISHLLQRVDHSLQCKRVRHACLFADVTIDAIIIVNIVNRNSGLKKANHLGSLLDSPASWCCPAFCTTSLMKSTKGADASVDFS